jgi:hypothetical protein
MTMKPMPYRELDLPIGNVPTGFRNPRVAFAGGRGQRRRGVPSQGWNGKATGASLLHPSLTP